MGLRLMEIALGLLSGGVVSLATTILSFILQENRDKRNRFRSLARERLNRVYGPLMLILETNQKVMRKSNKESFFFSDSEISKIDQIIFENYHLIEPERRECLSSLYSHRKFSEDAIGEKIVKVIREGYYENEIVSE